MNRNEIMNMQPGRELDALVAEKVMGWKAVGPSFHDQEENFVETVKHWKPSSSISVAWEVVEKMPGDLVVRRYETMGGTYRYVCSIAGEKPIIVDADTAPLAICRAALLSLIQEDTPQ